MVILSFVSSNNTFTCNTTFVSTSSQEDIKQSMRVKLEFSVFTTLASRDRRTASIFVLAKEWVTFCLKNSNINSNKCYLFSLFIECVHKSYHHILTSDFLFISQLMFSVLLVLCLRKVPIRICNQFHRSQFFQNMFNKNLNKFLMCTT